LLSFQKKFLFIHFPKTGGNSIQEVLKDFSEDEIITPAAHQDGIERFEVYNKKHQLNKHAALDDYKSALDRKTYRSLFKFSVIRNPWDRMISYYFSPHRGVTEWDRGQFLELVQNLPPCRKYICETSIAEKVAKRVGFDSFIPRKKLDSDLDYLIRFEHLEDDFKIVCRKIGIPCSPLAQRNRSGRRHYSEYYDDELREGVQRRFSDEIRFGGYTF